MMYSARVRTVGSLSRKPSWSDRSSWSERGREAIFCMASCLRSASSLKAARLGRCVSPYDSGQSSEPSEPSPSNSPSVGSSAGADGSSESVSEAGDSRRSTRIGFSLNSWSIRSCSAIKGNCKISIDWIMRGAIRRRISIRLCCEVSRRMVLDSVVED